MPKSNSKKGRTDLLNLEMFLPKSCFAATPIFSLEIALNLPTSNDQNKRKHLDVAAKKRVHDVVFAALKEKYGYNFPRITERILVYYVRHGQICDKDGLYSSSKWLMDTLVNLEIIPDDRPVEKKGGIVVDMFAKQFKGTPKTELYFYKEIPDNTPS